MRPNHMHQSSTIISALKKKGHRITNARKLIVDVIIKMDSPFSALDMHTLIAKKGLQTNKVTVYRELQFLEKEGIVQSAHFQDGTKRYCLADHGHHHHLVCTNCNDMQDIRMENDLDVIEKKIHKEKSFTVQSHVLEFYGLCSRCVVTTS